MLDDLAELVLDLALELGGAAWGQKKKWKKGPKRSPSPKASPTQKWEESGRKKGTDPWDAPREKPVWEK